MYDPYNDRMIVGVYQSAWTVLAEWIGEDQPSSYADAIRAGLAASISDDVVIIAASAFAGYVPVVGDVITATGGSRRIVEVEVAGGDYGITVSSAGLSGVTATWSQAISCTLEWQAQHLPGIGARWEEMHFNFQLSTSDLISVPSIDVGGYSERDTAVATVAPTMTTHSTSVKQSQIVRVGPPRDISRATHLYPYLKANTAATLWHLSEMELHHTAQERRVAR